MNPLPRPVRPFVAFAPVLRGGGFAVAPDQVLAFVEAVGLLGPGSMDDIHRAALATLAPPPERRAEFDALFRSHFLGQSVAAPTEGAEDDETEAVEERDGAIEAQLVPDEDEAGDRATALEVLRRREFAALPDEDALRRFRRDLPAALPVRRARRRVAGHGDRVDRRRALRQAVRRDGELFELPTRRRKLRRRPIALLIDVSGSMEEQAQGTMRLAHALVRAQLAGRGRIEAFTFGTRLTRVTRALSRRNEGDALDRIGALVADYDGGTRIGEALDALLAVPRFAGALRGAWTIVVSDGLERGDPALMIDAVRRIARLARRIDWLTPLADGEAYAPRTEALAGAAPHLDRIAPAGSLASLAASLLDHRSGRVRGAA